VRTSTEVWSHPVDMGEREKREIERVKSGIASH